MNVEYLIQLLENKLGFLRNAKVQAFNTGDLPTINSISEEIVGVEDTLVKLRLLNDLTIAAANAGNTEVDVITSGVEAIKNNPIILDDATECMGKYDISTYATDPLHEQKIADILSVMGAMNSAAEIDAYIDNEAIASPLTGSMILNAVQQYNVDCRLLMAIIELDSRFGTAGVAVNTLNPGNVGNTGTETRTYGSWEEGTTAVAEWLNRHRTIVATPQVQNNLNSLGIVPETVNVEVGDNYQLNTNVLDQNGNIFTGASIVFSSDNLNIATVDNAGLLKALSVGITVITATATSGSVSVTGISTITVKEKEIKKIDPILSSAAIIPATTEIVIGSNQQLMVETLDQEGKVFSGAKISFVSDKTDIVTVDNVGLLTALSAGMTTITATATSGSVSVTGSSTIIVKEGEIKKIDPILSSAAIIPATAEIVTGNTQQLTVETLDQEGKVFSGAEISFVSDKADIATVSSTGLVTALSAGVATVTATATSGSVAVTGSSTIKVVEASADL